MEAPCDVAEAVVDIDELVLVSIMYTDKLEFMTTPSPLAVDTGSDADEVTRGAEKFH